MSPSGQVIQRMAYEASGLAELGIRWEDLGHETQQRLLADARRRYYETLR